MDGGVNVVQSLRVNIHILSGALKNCILLNTFLLVSYHLWDPVAHIWYVPIWEHW